MVVKHPKTEVHTRGPLRPFMEARKVSIRDLVVKVSDAKASWSKSTIGNLHASPRATVHPELAKRIARALDFPYEVLFVERVSIVSREVGPNHETEHTPKRKGRAA